MRIENWKSFLIKSAVFAAVSAVVIAGFWSGGFKKFKQTTSSGINALSETVEEMHSDGQNLGKYINQKGESIIADLKRSAGGKDGFSDSGVLPAQEALPESDPAPDKKTPALGILEDAPPQAPDRKPFDYADFAIFSDIDGDCQDAYTEALIFNSAETVSLDSDGCLVVSGKWFDFFSKSWMNTPAETAIMHLVPLEWAYERGASGWSDSRKIAFGNDVENLLIVTDQTVSARSDRGIDQWVPENASETYRSNFCYIVKKYDLDYPACSR